MNLKKSIELIMVVLAIVITVAFVIYIYNIQIMYQEKKLDRQLLNTIPKSQSTPYPTSTIGSAVMLHPAYRHPSLKELAKMSAPTK